jgi:N-carbamoylputrescine amidase
MKPLRVGLVQHACTADREENIRRNMDGIRRARAGGADLVVLPELHATRYFPQTEDPALFDLAEPLPGPLTARFGDLARALGVVVVGSFFERRAPGLHHNTAVVFERDGTVAGRYRKMHVPDDPGYYEKFYFTPGDLGFHPIATSVGRLGVLVCWDQWYPEAARLMALGGADVLVYPTAIGWDPRDSAQEQERQLDAWVTVQRAHAIANGLPVVVVNRVGRESAAAAAEPGIAFWGNSFAAGCQGEVLARAGSGADEVLVADLDPGRTETVRRIWPFLRDRRVDAYGGLLERFRDRSGPTDGRGER